MNCPTIIRQPEIWLAEWRGLRSSLKVMVFLLTFQYLAASKDSAETPMLKMTVNHNVPSTEEYGERSAVT
jgi:hypothetical protein